MASFDVGAISAVLTFKDEMSATLKKVQASLGHMAKGASKHGESMVNTGATMTAGLTAPIVAMGSAVVFAASEFESSFAGVRKTVNATEPEFRAMSDAFREMATEIPVSVNELNAIGEAAGQLGIKKENIVDFTRTMADLGVTTNLSSTEAASALARLANITGMSQDDFDRLGSSVVALGNNMATTEAEIVEMSLRLAGIGSQIGLTEHEITAMAASMSSLGIQAEAGGSAMTRTLSEINSAVIGGGESLQGFAGMAGVSAGAFSEAWRNDPTKALTLVLDGLKRMGVEGGDTTLAMEGLNLTGVRIQDTLRRMSSDTELLSDALKVSAEGWEVNKALANEAEQRYATFASQLQVLWNQLQDVAIELGTALIPALKDMISLLTPLVGIAKSAAEVFATIPSPIRAIGLAVVGMLAAAGPFVTWLGLASIGIEKLLPFLNTLLPAAMAKTAIAAKTVWAALMGPLGWVAALAAVAAAVALFVTREGGMWDDWMAGTSESLGELRGGMGDLKEKFEDMTPSITAHNKVFAKFHEMGLKIPEAIRDLVEAGADADVVLGAIATASAENTVEGKALRAVLLEVSDEMNRTQREAAALTKANEDAAAAADTIALAEKNHAEMLERVNSAFTTQGGLQQKMVLLKEAVDSGVVPTVQLATATRRLWEEMIVLGLATPEARDAMLELAPAIVAAEIAAADQLKNIEFMGIETAGLAADVDTATMAFAGAAVGSKEWWKSQIQLINWIPTLSLETVKLNETLKHSRQAAEGATGIFGKLGSVFGGVLGTVKKLWSGLTGGKNNIGGLFEQLGSGIVEGFGAIVSGGLTALAGKAVAMIQGFIMDMFKSANAAEHVEEQFGLALSEGLLAAIDGLAKSLGGGAGSLDAAFRMLMVDAIKEASITSLADLQMWVTNVHEILSSVDEGLIEMGEAVTVMADSWLALVPAMEATGGSAMDLQSQIADLIARGVDLEDLSASLEPVLLAMFDSGIEGAQELVDWLAEMGVEFDNLNLKATTLEDAFKTAGIALKDWEHAVQTVKDIEAEIAQLESIVDHQAQDSTQAVRDWMASIGADTSRSFDAIKRHWETIGAGMGFSSQRIQAEIRREWQQTQQTARDAFSQVAADSGLTGAALEADVQKSMKEWRIQVRKTERENARAAKQETRDRLRELKAQLREAKKQEREKRKIYKVTFDALKRWTDDMTDHWVKKMQEMLDSAKALETELTGNSIFPDMVRASIKEFDKLEVGWSGNMTGMAGSAAGFSAPLTSAPTARPASNGSAAIVARLDSLERVLVREGAERARMAAWEGARMGGRRR